VNLRPAIALAALVAAAPAAAQEQESPRWGSFDLMLSGYRPKIDQEFGAGAPGPYQTAFGNGRGLMVRFHAAKSLFTGFGSLEAGLGAGYFEKFGRGVNSLNGQPADSTGFKVLPLRAFLAYRFDLLARLYNIPIVPFGRASLDRYQWWVLNGQGNTANSTGLVGRGATNGYSFSGGAAFLLDFLDSGVARDMDRDLGINDTYLFVDFTKSFVNDFGSAKSWNLSDEKVTISGGLMFVF
jgi:hypothetical protein